MRPRLPLCRRSRLTIDGVGAGSHRSGCGSPKQDIVEGISEVAFDAGTGFDTTVAVRLINVALLGRCIRPASLPARLRHTMLAEASRPLRWPPPSFGLAGFVGGETLRPPVNPRRASSGDASARRTAGRSAAAAGDDFQPSILNNNTAVRITTVYSEGTTTDSWAGDGAIFAKFSNGQMLFLPRPHKTR